MSSTKIPVTVLTGFLGSGKTTLLNRILTEQHGQRIAVIENEFGEIGIDNELVINADEEIFEMNNGCICCTVRGDLIRILGNLAKRRDKFDRILLETTGMADPGPVAQTFFMDADIQEQFFLDGIITLVDARHVVQHIDDSDEVKAQIGFADLILLNKADLVETGAVQQLRTRLESMNRMARVVATVMAETPVDQLLDIGGFNLDRALELNPRFLEPEYPFEWAGLYELPAADIRVTLSNGPDPDLELVLVRTGNLHPKTFLELAEQHFRAFAHEAHDVLSGGSIEADGSLHRLKLQGEDRYVFNVEIEEAGRYCLFSQHLAEEFSISVSVNGHTVPVMDEHRYNAAHEHAEEVGSVAFEFPGDLDGLKLDKWLSGVLQIQGADIFRMKGILAIAGEPRRHVFQGVHMLFDSTEGLPWGNEARTNRLVFIGRALDRDFLEGGLKQCLS
jgi:G3E family GTPase